MGYLQQALEAFQKVQSLFWKQPCDDYQRVYNKTVYNMIMIYGQLNETSLALKMLSSYR